MIYYENRAISEFWEIGGVKSHCLIESRCKRIMISPEFTQAAKIKMFTLKKPIGIQLEVMDSKSIKNYGMNTIVNITGDASVTNTGEVTHTYMTPNTKTTQMPHFADTQSPLPHTHTIHTVYKLPQLSSN